MQIYATPANGTVLRWLLKASDVSSGELSVSKPHAYTLRTITLSRDSMNGKLHTMSHPRLLWQHAITARTLYTLRHVSSAVLVAAEPRMLCSARVPYVVQCMTLVLCSTDNILDYAFMHLLTTCATADASETEL
eukprot:6983-Heterococcus_DN1.PRE.1